MASSDRALRETASHGRQLPIVQIWLPGRRALRGSTSVPPSADGFAVPDDPEVGRPRLEPVHSGLDVSGRRLM